MFLANLTASAFLTIACKMSAPVTVPTAFAASAATFFALLASPAAPAPAVNNLPASPSPALTVLAVEPSLAFYQYQHQHFLCL
ncbi:hypothetical protein BHY_1459 (plasmid) [Borrelia nietonii YOR]|uniref:Variable outer membrane protein n=1 Tax=Borrelia nietonii YOR TaxID=1293576 RepID=W5SBF2_9SPIR|nr:hypothetical protein BHY_1459 [Borrelia nietonii YOR]